MGHKRANAWEERQRRRMHYEPVMQFAFRIIQTAMFDAMQAHCVPCPYGDPNWQKQENTISGRLLWLCGQDWDLAVMAREWIRRQAPDPRTDREGYLLSFDHCCEVMGLDADYERLWMLDKIDAAADFDTDEVWARIDYLTENPPDEEKEPLFDAPRVVPELDQHSLFGFLEAA